MKHDLLVLRKPVLSDADYFIKIYQETQVDAKETQTPFAFDFDPEKPFSEFLTQLKNCEQGINIPSIYVPSSYFIGVVDGAIVGRLSFRHQLNDFLLSVAGHIGYYVVPEFRRKGYATQMLSQALLIAKDLVKGDRVLVTCDKDNQASMRTIEKCGGVLENIYDGEFAKGSPKRRYWIAL